MRWLMVLGIVGALVASTGCPSAPVTPNPEAEAATPPPTEDPRTETPEASQAPAIDLSTLRGDDTETDSCMEHCLRRSQAMAMAWDAIVAQCERSCAP